jgi:mannose-6-phosphate isomerase-like protein (cupin superfamily)
MPVIVAPTGPTHELPGARFTALVTPSSAGATDTSVWLVELDPSESPAPHSLTREEVFVVLEGTAAVRIGEERTTAGPSSAILVPAEVPFEIAPAGADLVRLLCCLPVGGRARLDDGTLLTPPWAE